MKKVLSIILVLIFAVGTPLNLLPAHAEEFAKGDVTGDRNIDIADILMVRNILLHTVTDPAKVARADVNKDTEYDIADMIAVRNIIINMGYEPEPARPPLLKTPIAGIEVSSWTSNVDWNKVKTDGIDFAMIRSSYDINYDNKFKSFYSGAKRAGLEVGVFHSNYSRTVEGVKKEAAFCLDAIKGYEMDFPIVYYIEDYNIDILAGVTKGTLTDMAIAFCEVVREAGYYPMIYCNLVFLENRYDTERLIENCDIWLSSVEAEPIKYSGSYGIWQYSYNSIVAGINESAHVNRCYRDYTAFIRKYGYNHLT